MVDAETRAQEREQKRQAARRALGAPTCRILDAMVWLESGRIPMPWPKSLVAYAAAHLPRGGLYKGGLASLVGAGAIGYRDGQLVLEHEGREVALPIAQSPSGEGAAWSREAYRERLYSKLNRVERAICQGFETVEAIERHDLGPLCGAAEHEIRAALSKLLAVGLLDVSGDVYTRTQVLYPLTVFERRERDR